MSITLKAYKDCSGLYASIQREKDSKKYHLVITTPNRCTVWNQYYMTMASAKKSMWKILEKPITEIKTGGTEK